MGDDLELWDSPAADTRERQHRHRNELQARLITDWLDRQRHAAKTQENGTSPPSHDSDPDAG